jgi:hypothetical protein
LQTLVVVLLASKTLNPLNVASRFLRKKIVPGRLITKNDYLKTGWGKKSLQNVPKIKEFSLFLSRIFCEFPLRGVFVEFW